MIDFDAMARSLRVVDRLQPFQLSNARWDALKPADAVPVGGRQQPVSNKPQDTVKISDEAFGKLEKEKSVSEIDIEDIVKGVQNDQHQYDYTQANAAPLNTYNRNDQSLIDKVQVTRLAVELSGNISGAKKGTGLELSGSHLYNYVEKMPAEIASLKGQLSEQMANLGIDRSQGFTLTQNDSGQILVAGGDDATNTKAGELLNSSEHFKETFHLLKTAENVYDVRLNGENYADKAFKLDVSSESLTSNVKILEKGQQGSVLQRINKISDTEMYWLARTGISAIVAKYEYG